FALEAKKPALDARFTSASFNIFLLLGDVYFDRGEFIEAFSYYRNAVEEAKSRHAKAAALVSAAYAAENLKNSDEAIAILRQVVASGVKEVKADAMLALARNLFQKGDRDGAVKQLNEVSKEFPNTVWATSAEGFQKLWTSEKSVSP
ncbi:MAG TPA: tetratricopeptide repeat protein, partial [Oligoflexia bacterium]|nr:tetratricopeptide repeat protein [Oligoflexia bacterium]